MDKEQLLKLMLEIDPTTKRVPPGIQAIVNKAIELERKVIAEELKYLCELEGFGCSCEYTTICSTCKARELLHKTLDPMICKLS